MARTPRPDAPFVREDRVAMYANVTRKTGLKTGLTIGVMLMASCSPSDEEVRARAVVTPLAAPSPPTRAKQPRTVSAPTITAAPAAVAAWPAVTTTVTAKAGDKVKALAAAIATELAARCPVAEAGDQSAFDACRKAMFGGSKIQASLSPVTYWGRQNKDPEAKLSDTGLTQFGPDVLTGMYMPLFMFSGQHAISYSPTEKLYRVELGVKFRNRLPPGQFPYPFWHEDEKWNTYENANAILLWIDPQKLAITTAQFTARGTIEPPASPKSVAQAPFDGQWMWTDATGAVQPKVTLFDGLFQADNPHLKTLDSSYRELAVSLRDGQCMACHVPNNPYKTKRLVLLQTPAHAAAEIKRVMATVKRGAMPLDQTTGIEEPLKGELKGELLKRAAAFEKVVDDAKAWEASAAKSPATAKQPPAPAPTQPPRKTAQSAN